MASYCLNGNADDASVNSSHGTLNGGLPITDRNGKDSGAIIFDGIDDNITVSEFLVPNTSFTFSFWTKMEQKTNGIAFWVENTSNSNRISGSINYSHNGVNSVFWDVGGVSPPRRLETQGKSLVTSWEHYVMIYDADLDSTYCYLDGNLFMSGALNVNIDASSKKLFIGSGQNALYFKGALDDFRVYNRAVSKAEVSMLYAANDDCTTTADIPEVVSMNHQPSVSMNIDRVNGILHLVSETEVKFQNVIYDLSGKICYTGSDKDIDINELPPAVYVFRSSLGLAQKFVVFE